MIADMVKQPSRSRGVADALCTAEGWCAQQLSHPTQINKPPDAPVRGPISLKKRPHAPNRYSRISSHLCGGPVINYTDFTPTYGVGSCY